MKKLILASASPRRRDILNNAGYTFEVRPLDVDEGGISVSDPQLLVRELALLKAAACAKETPEDAFVIGADTLVSLDGEVMGKPTDFEDAVRMLSRLSGRSHQVYTGVCVINTKNGAAISKNDTTHVTFRTLTEAEIRDYVSTGEPMDKAGAYAIQGIGQKLVSGIDGDLNNVIGFPVHLFEAIVAELEAEEN